MKSSHRHLLSLLALAGLLVLAAGSQESEEDKAARLEREAARAEQLQAYMKQMGAIHTALEKVDHAKLKNKKCDGTTIHTNAAPTDTGYISLRAMHAPFFERFTTDEREVWDRNETAEFNWISDSTFAGHFDSHPEDRDKYAVNDTAKRVEETFAPERYLIVVQPTAGAKNKMPVWHKKGPYDIGSYQGWAFIVDQTDAKILCQRQIKVKSSSEIKWREGGFTDQDPANVLKRDFQDQFEEEVEALLPQKVKLYIGYGSIF